MTAWSTLGPPLSTGTFPFGERWALSGELHRGLGLGGMWGAIGASVVYNGPETSQYASVIGVNTVGGWSQLKFKPAEKWEINGAFGEESPFAADLLQNGDPTYLPVLRNWTTMVNVIDRPRSNLLLSLEYRHLNTVLVWRTNANRRAHQPGSRSGVLMKTRLLRSCYCWRAAYLGRSRRAVSGKVVIKQNGKAVAFCGRRGGLAYADEG